MLFCKSNKLFPITCLFPSLFLFFYCFAGQNINAFGIKYQCLRYKISIDKNKKKYIMTKPLASLSEVIFEYHYIFLSIDIL